MTPPAGARCGTPAPDEPIVHSQYVAPRPQLLTYPDALGGDLRALAAVLEGPLAGCFHGVHVLPPFPSSADRGFAPVTYQEIDPRFGTWQDLERIGQRHDLVLDLMINHLSRESAEFQDFQRRGRRSPSAALFITLDKIWPGGDPPAGDLARIFLRKPLSPFSTITVSETGVQERIWTSFGTAEWSDQIDIDITSGATRRLIGDWLRWFASKHVRVVRLDAVGYVIKKAGSSCFMVEPEVYEFLAWLSGQAEALDLVLLPEVHDTFATHERLARSGFWTYDFVLPGLVLHAIETGESARLAEHLSSAPQRVFTTLDCHDGIPVRPDLDGILEPAQMLALADTIQRRGGNINRILSHAQAEAVDVHQLNCTYYSALGCDDDRYICARAIQLFAPGVPQVYYVGLLAGENDDAAVARSGDGRAINRRNYAAEELRSALDRPVVRRLLALVRLRNTHAAFDGSVRVEAVGASVLRVCWEGKTNACTCSLEVDLASGRAMVDPGTGARPV